MDDYIEKLTKYYEKIKLKTKEIEKSKSKKTFKPIVIPDIERKQYLYYNDYVKDLEEKIKQEKKKLLELKYDILYDLITESEKVEEYDKIEKNIKDLITERDLQLLKYKHKEQVKKQEINKIIDEIKSLLIQYREIPEEKKDAYVEIKKKRREIHSIMNKYSCIITNKEHNKNIYVYTKDYNPIIDNEILIDVEENAFQDLEYLDLDAVN